MTPTTPTPTDAQALLSAICAEPAEDLHRLAYADLLDEQEPVRATCPRCGGDGVHTVKVDGEPNQSLKGRRACGVCNGHRTILDTSAKDRAEFIRVQVELARAPAGVHNPIGGCADLNSPAAKQRREYDNLRLCPTCRLKTREAELLRLHADQWRPEALREMTHGRFARVVGSVYNVPVEYRRGFISHITTTAAQWLDGFDRRAPVPGGGACPECKGTGDRRPTGQHCEPCLGTGTGTAHRGDGFAARVVLSVPLAPDGVKLSDREPDNANDPLSPRGYSWWRDNGASAASGDHFRHHIRAVLFDAIRGGTVPEFSRGNLLDFPTPEAAHAALSTAAVSVARESAGLPRLVP